MSPTPDLLVEDGVNFTTPPSISLSSSNNKKKMSPTKVGGSRRVTPTSFRKTPKSKSVSPKQKKEQEPQENVGTGDKNGSPSPKKEVSFENHKQLCDRVAKSLYFANKLPTTPRPSLPLTKLAVSTFSKQGKKDTLAGYLDLEAASEIGRNACVTPTALIMAIVYLERLSSSNPGYLGTVTPSDLFVVSLLVASKFIQDDGEELGIFNDEWATSAHLELKKLNGLELEFLTAIDWRVKVGPDEYSRVLGWLEQEVSLGEGSKRGWFTYTEVSTLLSFHLLWPTIYSYYIKVIIAATITYATVLATLISSSVLGPQIFMLSKHCLTNLITSSYQQQPFLLHQFPCSSNSTKTKLKFQTNKSSGLRDDDDEQQQEMTEVEMTNLVENLEQVQFINVQLQQLENGFPWFRNDSLLKGNYLLNDDHTRSRRMMWTRPGQSDRYTASTEYNKEIMSEKLYSDLLTQFLLKHQQSSYCDTRQTGSRMIKC